MAPTSTLAPTLPSVDLPSTLLIFGVPAVVGLILALAALWGFLACKVGKQRRKRKAADEEAEGRGPLVLPVTASQGSQGRGDCLPPAPPRHILVETGSSTLTWAPWAPRGILGQLSCPLSGDSVLWPLGTHTCTWLPAGPR